MPLFPPGVPVTVQLDGRTLPVYLRAYEANGRVYAAMRPLVTSLADRLWFEGNVLVIARDGRIVRVAVSRRRPDAFDTAYVAIAPLLRALGASVAYDAKARVVVVRSPGREGVATPSPFDAGAPTAAPTTVFTPAPEQTPRPVWSGSPLPRRTPLPATAPPG